MAKTIWAEGNVQTDGTSSKDVMAVGGDSSTTVLNATINAGAGNDSIQVQYASGTHVDAGEGNDTINLLDISYGNTVSTGDGNDVVNIYSSDTTTINLGGGTNTILAATQPSLKSSIDVVINAGNNSTLKFDYANGAAIGNTTITAGTGNVIRGTAGVDNFSITGGNNTIYGFGGEDKINLTTVTTLEGSNDVTLSGASANAVIKGGKAHYINSAKQGDYKTSTPQGVIKAFMKALDNTKKSGTDALDEAVLSLNSKKFASMKEVIDAAVADCKKVGNADAFLSEYCGIMLDNADTGALTGWDAGGSANKTAESIVPESGSGISADTSSSFTVDGVTFTGSPANETQQKIWYGLKNYWIKGAFDLISSTYGSNFSFSGGTAINESAKSIKVTFVNSGSFVAQVKSTTASGSDTATSLELQINMSYFGTLSDDVNGVGDSNKTGYLDRTIAHEMTHAIMAATINDFGDLPAYIKEGMAELTHGIDDERRDDIYALAGSSGNLNKALSTATDSSKVKISKINAPSYAGGFILLRYLAQQVADSDLSDGIRENAKKTAVSITDVASSITAVTADMYESTVVTVDSSSATKALIIEGNAKDNAMYANSTYNMTLNGGAGKDKLYGSSGSDTFVIKVGNGSDVIGNTAKGQTNTLYQDGDKIVVLGDAASVSADGFLSFKDSKNVVTVSFKGSNDKLTINKEDTLTPVTFELKSDLAGETVKTITHNMIPAGVTLDSKFTTASLTADATLNQVFDISEMNSQLKIVNGMNATVPVSIVGNSQATTVSLGAKGGTVIGGFDYTKNKGLDDKFYGNEGSDVFVYSVGGGKDQVFNYNGSNDTIVLLGVSDISTISTVSSEAVSYKDNGTAVVLTLKQGSTSGTLTLNKPEGQIKVYKDSVSDANEILKYGIELPNYTHYNDKKTAVMIDSGYNTETKQSDTALISIELNKGYSANVKEVDASAYGGTTNIVGNDKADVLRASKGGSTIDGGSGVKSTGDKLYGNAGADVFVYKILPSIGGGTDVIGGDSKNTIGNYQSQDKIYIASDTGLTANDVTIKDSNLVTTLTFNGNKKDKLTINKESSDTSISLFFGANDAAINVSGTPALEYGKIPDGVSYGKKSNKIDYTMLSVGSAAANTTIEAAKINSQIKNFDLSSATSTVYVFGNATANNITLGAAGATADGGAGNDKIYGNSAATVGSTFIHTFGDGKDEIYGYNGNQDTIIVNGYTTPIDTDNKNVFKDTGKDITLNFTSGTTKSSLTIKNPNGKLTILGKDENGANTTLLSYGANLPDPAHMFFNSSKTVLTIASDSTITAADKTLKLRDYGITLKEINASAFSTTGLHMIAADGKANILTAGDAASTLQGGTGADKLYGGGKADTFVYSVGGGKDEIYNFNGAQSDEILLLGYEETGIAASNTKIFKDTGKDITITLGTNKLTLKSPTGQLNIFGATVNDSGAITKGASLLKYDSNLDAGVSYNATKTMLTVDSSVSVATTIDASKEYAYANTLKVINASTTSVNVALTGNANANDIYGGKAASTLNGGDGSDKLYGNSGGKDTFAYDHRSGAGGKDMVYNYNAAEGDVISLSAAVETGGMKVTYNGKTLVFNYADKIDGKSVTGSLTINGKSTGGSKYANIDTATTVAIQVGTEAVKYYQFRNTKLKNLALDAAVSNGDVVTVSGAGSGGSGSQFASTSEQYWFEQAPAVEVDSTDEINELLAIEPTTSTLEEFDELSTMRKDLNSAFVSTDIRKKKELR